MKTITVTIEASESVILRVERFLAWLHLCSRWGHSGTVCMDLDGDGNEKVSVAGISIEEHREFVKNIRVRNGQTRYEYIHSGDQKK